VKEKAETLAFVLGEIGAGRSFPSQDHLAARVGVVKSTISKWLGEWEGAGNIPLRARQGRCKVIGGVSSS
jgi:DNA-binding transcriptional regulator YhcF (GntR family)